MKKSDIAMIVLISSISVFVSFFISKAVFGDPQEESVKVKTIETFTSDIKQPDKRVFNMSAINPTIEIIIGGESKQADNNEDSKTEEENTEQTTRDEE